MLAYRLTGVKPSSGSPRMFVLVLSGVREKVDLNELGPAKNKFVLVLRALRSY